VICATFPSTALAIKDWTSYIRQKLLIWWSDWKYQH